MLACPLCRSADISTWHFLIAGRWFPIRCKSCGARLVPNRGRSLLLFLGFYLVCALFVFLPWEDITLMVLLTAFTTTQYIMAYILFVPLEPMMRR